MAIPNAPARAAEAVADTLAANGKLNRFQAIDPRLLRQRPGHAVLDVGCGIGRTLLDLSKTKGRHVGVDMDRTDLMKALYWSVSMCIEGTAPRRIQAMQADGTRLPFVDGSFDRVVCTEVLEHVPDDHAVLDELVRVLRPGGVIAISVPAELCERVFWRISEQYRTAIGGHVRIYRRRQIESMLRGRDVQPYAVRYRHSVETVYWLVRIVESKSIYTEGPLTSRVRRYLGALTPQFSDMLDRLDTFGNYLLPKSLVVYGRKPGAAG